MPNFLTRITQVTKNQINLIFITVPIVIHPSLTLMLKPKQYMKIYKKMGEKYLDMIDIGNMPKL